MTGGKLQEHRLTSNDLPWFGPLTGHNGSIGSTTIQSRRKVGLEGILSLVVGGLTNRLVVKYKFDSSLEFSLSKLKM